MFFKVYFDKAYDSVSWEYLLKCMKFMGFDSKWIRWIKVFLISYHASVLVNGSPTKEFSLNRGFRQGGPLSLFLFFILVTEGLDVAMEDAVNQGLFRGLIVGDLEFKISHLFYVDDDLFLGEWDKVFKVPIGVIKVLGSLGIY